MDEHDEQWETGLRIRSEVLGSEFTERVLAESDDFDREFSLDYANEKCWGYVWARPLLDRRTRSIVCLSVLAASGKWEELRSHVRGALRNGVTPEEIKEVLLQIAVYCGIPTGGSAFRTAKPVIHEWREEQNNRDSTIGDDDGLP